MHAISNFFVKFLFKNALITIIQFYTVDFIIITKLVSEVYLAIIILDELF